MAIPKFVQRAPRRYRWYWKHPWSRFARRSSRFRQWCWNNGYVSPHFSRDEWASKDGTPVPSSLRTNAQRQAFALERFRHALGDRPVRGLSYYRSPAHNRAVGGVTNSRHLYADATDFSTATVNAIGRTRFFSLGRKFFDGIGTYPSGSAHLDSRGYAVEWRSY